MIKKREESYTNEQGTARINLNKYSQWMLMPKDTTKMIPRQVTSRHTECCICLVKKATINQPCGLTAHKICVSCITKIIETIPISQESPEIHCQYPFTNCEYTYTKAFIKTILKDRYPIYKLAKDMYTYKDYSVNYCPGCRKILVFDEDIEEAHVYECIYCFRAYCFTCRMESSQIDGQCEKCCNFYNINPLALNRFFYKDKPRKTIADFLYINSQIDCEEACKQITERVTNITVKCPICTTPLSRSEQCNSLKHCHTEICYNCGEFSNIGDDLGDHWSARGHGCPRWESDPAFKTFTPDYTCVEGECYSHSNGDCRNPTHTSGKHSYNEFKRSQYVYHSLKSLLPRIRYKLIEMLPENVRNYLPRAVTWDRLDCNSEYDDIRNHIVPPSEI